MLEQKRWPSPTPSQLKERQERAEINRVAFHAYYDRKPAKFVSWVLRDARNNEVFNSSTEAEAISWANNIWSRWRVTGEKELSSKLPRALIFIDQWGDEIFVRAFPDDTGYVVVYPSSEKLKIREEEDIRG